MAAACLSPSPSGRRLSELLEEKQEPFVLDLHLLQKGCSSSRLLDTALLCWPAPGNDAAAAVLKRLTSNKNKQASRSGGGLIKLLLSKVLRKGKHQQQQQGRTKKQEAERYAYDSDEKQLSPVSVLDHPFQSSPAYDSDEKQLSPVSVLDHPFQSSPAHAKLLSPSSKHVHAMDVFRELLDAALLAQSDDLATDSTTSSSSSTSSCCSAADEDDEDEDCYDHRASPKNGAAYWEAHRAELALVSELVASEVPTTARLDLAALLPEREGVGAAVADAVLHALLRELVADLLATC